MMPEITVGLASEASFGPHSGIPFCASDHEIVVLVDHKSGLELSGHHAAPGTNFSHVVATDVAAGRAFAKKVGSPHHGVIVMACRDRQPAHGIALNKTLGSWDELTSARQAISAKARSAFVETDMRAHRNPRRMGHQARNDRSRPLCTRPVPCARPAWLCRDRAARRPAMLLVRRADSARKG